MAERMCQTTLNRDTPRKRAWNKAVEPERSEGNSYRRRPKRERGRAVISERRRRERHGMIAEEDNRLREPYASVVVR